MTQNKKTILAFLLAVFLMLVFVGIELVFSIHDEIYFASMVAGCALFFSIRGNL